MRPKRYALHAGQWVYEDEVCQGAGCHIAISLGEFHRCIDERNLLFPQSTSHERVYTIEYVGPNLSAWFIVGGNIFLAKAEACQCYIDK